MFYVILKSLLFPEQTVHDAQNDTDRGESYTICQIYVQLKHNQPNWLIIDRHRKFQCKYCLKIRMTIIAVSFLSNEFMAMDIITTNE